MISYQERQENGEESELFQEHTQEEVEEEGGGRFESGAIHHLSMLHLNSATKYLPTTTTTEKCTACGGSMKRPSPSFVSSLLEPSPKRVTLLPPSSSSPTTAGCSGAAVTNSASIGSKRKPSLLYRSLSEPIDSLGVLNTQTGENPKAEEFRSLSAFGQFLNSLTPENSKITSAAWKLPSPVKNSDSLPPLPPLDRSFSDPTAALEFRPPAVATPPKPSVATQAIKSPPSSAEESPNTKRLKRMRERLRQMRQWWDQVLQEEDQDSYSEDNNSKEEKGPEPETSPEESVWVEEKAGEGLVIHFKCPCKKGYEILLSGNNCYYKLM